MVDKIHPNTRARMSALALLYSSDITELDVESIVEEGRYPEDDFELPEYAEELVLGVSEHLDEIDDLLDRASENWSLLRMPVVDRALLRLAVFEMIYVDDVPVSVTIDEAVELAKDYGGEDDSSRFVNGVLGRIASMIEDGTISKAVPAEKAESEADQPDEADEPVQESSDDESQG
ncbi:MAG: transcription antitermination factor NusB [Eggerthellaceae bacterium]|nr:transcription antitermination factor NusB [Eggerthellaceae bacterium]